MHVLLKADGTAPTEIVPSLLGGAANDGDLGKLYDTAQMGTVRHYLSFYAFHTTPAFKTTADGIQGIDWRSSANSAVGNVEGITVPTLVMAGTCAAHIVPNELAYDHSHAQDKEFTAVEGADHFFRACKPQYGDSGYSKKILILADFRRRCLVFHRRGRVLDLNVRKRVGAASIAHQHRIALGIVLRAFSAPGLIFTSPR